MNKGKIIEITILFLFLITIILFIASYKINYLDLDKIGIFLFFLSAFINGMHWKKIILDLNKEVNSLKEAADILNEFSKKTSSWRNYLIQPQFKDPGVQEHKFQNHPKKTLTSAVVVMSEDRFSIVPILLLPITPIWFFGIDKFMYERYYQASPIIHDILLYLGIAVITWILWPSTSYSISSYLVKREIK